MSPRASATVFFPTDLDSLEPIELFDGLTQMEAAFVGRSAINSIPEKWARIGMCGIYVLLSNLTGELGEGEFEAYVGYTKTGFERRLFSHDDNKNFWAQAILFTRPNLTSTQAQWLEGDIVRLLKAGDHVKVHNIRYTGDETLPESELEAMERISLFVMRILFLRGYRSRSLAVKVKILEEKTSQVDLGTSEANFKTDPRFIRLREWRMVAAKAKGWSPNFVFDDKTLWAIICAKPTSLGDLAKVPGVGPAKLSEYGDALLGIVNSDYEGSALTS